VEASPKGPILSTTCEACARPISGDGLTRRFCSSQCHQAFLTAQRPGQTRDPGVLLVQLFFALMSEVMSGPTSPEIIDEANRMRDSWQRDLGKLRQMMGALREERRRAAAARAERARQEAEARARQARQARSQAPSLHSDLSVAYQLLGLGPLANAEEAQRAFRALALRYHPDKNPNDPIAEERFKRLNQAYNLVQNFLKGRKSLGFG
jgi:hypothetical protein